MEDWCQTDCVTILANPNPNSWCWLWPWFLIPDVLQSTDPYLGQRSGDSKMSGKEQTDGHDRFYYLELEQLHYLIDM